MNKKNYFFNRWRSITMMLALTAAFAAMPLTVSAATVSADYTLYLNDADGLLYKNNASGNNVTAEMNAAGAVVTGSAGARVLTLTNFSFETTANTALLVHANMNIVLVGTNTLTSTNSGGLDSYGIYVQGDLTIGGSGSLETTSGNASITYGIFALYNIIVKGGTVVATGMGSGTNKFGIRAGLGTITINGGTITAIGNSCAFDPDYTVPSGYIYTVAANTTGTSPTTGTSTGTFTITSAHKYAKIEVLPKDYTLYLNDADGLLYKNNASGTEVTAEMNAAGAVVTGGSAGARVLTLTNFDFTTSAANALEVPGGTTINLVGNSTIESTGSDLDSYGIYSSGNLTITSTTGGILNVTGGNASFGDSRTNSNGINAYWGLITISGNATVNATGGAATLSSGSGGIFSNNGDVNIQDNATVNAVGGTTESGFSYGIRVEKGGGASIAISDNANVSATGNTYGISYRTWLNISGSSTVFAKGGATYGLYGGYSANINGSSVVTAIGETSAMNFDYFVPNEYIYTLAGNTAGSSPTIGVSDGSFVITSLAVPAYKYANIQAVITYGLSYNRNGGTGTAPLSVYKPTGATVAVASESGITAPDGKQFKEWNTANNGSGTVYNPGDIFTIGTSSTTLYAIWEDATAGSTFTISASTLTSFGSLTEGYAQPAAQTVTITNTGTGAVTLTQPTATNYDLSALSTTLLAAGATATFTVQPKAGLTAGNYNAVITISGNSGAATATVNANFTVTSGTPTTPPTPPASYSVNIGIFTGGSVTASRTIATAGDIVTLTVSPETGYELDEITAFRTYSPATAVTLSGTANTRTFSMPAAHVTVEASFKKTARQIQWEKALAIIGNAAYNVPQQYAGTPEQLAVYLADYINGLLRAAGINLTLTPADIWIETGSFLPSTSGANGSFTFFVMPAAVFGSNLNSGVIVAGATSNEQLTPDAGQLRAYTQDGVLHVSGLPAGGEWRIYNVTGTLIYQGVASDVETQCIASLPSRGVYIVTDGKKTIKVVN